MNKMKKIFIFLVVVVIMTTMIACSTSTYTYSDNNKEAKEDYKYLNGWNVANDNLEIVSAMDYVKKYADPAPTDYIELLRNIKTAVKDSVQYPELLDWAKFEKLENVYKVSVSEEDVSAMSPEELIVFSSYAAFYDDSSDAMYIMPAFYAVTDEEKVYCFVHETIHSLISNRKDKDDNMLVEGLVDWLAVGVCSNLGLTVAGASYSESINCVRMLADIYGETETVRAICEDRIVSLIDGSIGAGMAERLNLALYVVHGGTGATIEDRSYASNVELDIVAHIAKREGKDLSEWKWIDTTKASYESAGIGLDVDYLKKI